jgi:hypothetical protein
MRSHFRLYCTTWAQKFYLFVHEKLFNEQDMRFIYPQPYVPMQQVVGGCATEMRGARLVAEIAQSSMCEKTSAMHLTTHLIVRPSPRTPRNMDEIR